MDKALIDTDILSEIMRGRNSRVLEHAATYSDEYRAFTVSVVTVAEVVKGLRKVSRALALERFIAELPQFEVLPIILKWLFWRATCTPSLSAVDSRSDAPTQ